MNKNIVIIAGVVVITGVGYFALMQSKTETVCADEICEVDMTTELVFENEESLILEIDSENTTSGSFETYSADKIAAATGDVIIFFHATWCPSCRVLSNDIEKNANTIPAGTTILKADYDTETELKKKYGVTTQHTLVQVDIDGNLIKKWSGGSKLTNLLSEIQ